MGDARRRWIPWGMALALGCTSPSEESEQAAPAEVRDEGPGRAEDASAPPPARLVSGPEVGPEVGTEVDPEVGTEVEPEPAPLAVTLRASGSLMAELVPLEDREVAEAEVSALFRSLSEASAPFCAFKHGLADWDGAAAKAYLARPGVYRRAGTGSKYGVIAGCWNFLNMNDRAPHRDFELVAALYGASAHDCVSVGLIQPYLMHQQLGCRRLTALDFDWRIQHVHWQLIGLAREGLLDVEGQAVGLEQLELSYIAHRRARPEHPGRIDSLCHQGMTSRCLDALQHFQRSLAPDFAGVRPDRFQLELAALHDARFSPAPEVEDRPLRVVYLSNALEPIYTRRREARALLDHLAAALAADETAVLIHHAGGRRGFGIYELRREGEERIVRVRCRDAYESTATDAESETYETWLDGEASGAAQPPTCRELLGRTAAEAGRDPAG